MVFKIIREVLVESECGIDSEKTLIQSLFTSCPIKAVYLFYYAERMKKILIKNQEGFSNIKYVMPKDLSKSKIHLQKVQSMYDNEMYEVSNTLNYQICFNLSKPTDIIAIIRELDNYFKEFIKSKKGLYSFNDEILTYYSIPSIVSPSIIEEFFEKNIHLFV